MARASKKKVAVKPVVNNHCEAQPPTPPLPETTMMTNSVRDAHMQHIWCWEPDAIPGKILTHDGTTQIKLHQYQPGQYTWLDLKLNPIWTRLTEALPMTLAPNLVSLYGGLHCLVAYLLIWYHAPNFVEDIAPLPTWVLLVNAYCMTLYYTLDCMDGKQARRTNSSSPIGQLFDHGLDCICLLAHLSIVQAWLQITGTTQAVWYFGLQATLQFSFFVAQWEEYHTGVLPHATGQIGVTEVSYGMAVASLLNAVCLKDRRAFYGQEIDQFLPDAFLTMSQGFKESVLRPYVGIDSLQLKHAFCLGWFGMMTMLICLSIRRVLSHLSSLPNHHQSSKIQLQGSALLKLLSPFAVAVSPFLLPGEILYQESRFISLAAGLAMCLITIKIIVFSMAKQAYATVQGDSLVVLAVVAWLRLDSRWKPPGHHLLWLLTTLYYVIRLGVWIRTVLRQLCDRLDIELFRIKAKKE
jgi:ethanolaminephosphotransferase